MRPPGTSEASAFDVGLSSLGVSDFSEILQPLHAHRNKLLVVDGLCMASAEADLLLNGHDLGTRHALTCARFINGTAGGPSIDQIVAQQVAVPGRVPSLELAVINTRNGGAIWRGPGLAVAPDKEPSSVYSRLFPSSFVGTTPTMADRVQGAQQSVLDVVQAQYAALAPRLSSTDRQKLELHRDLVRDVELRLEGLPAAECARPSAPSTNGSSDASNYDSRAEAMFSLSAAALACDLTRVVTIQMDQLTNSQIGAPPGDVHADYAHQWETNPTAHQMMTNYGKKHAQHFASLLAKLDAIPEGNGTLLDSCAVLWVGELADGTHHFRPWPVVIGGGAMRGGRYVYLPAETPNPSPYDTYPGWDPLVGPPHNKMWVSVARAVGADIDQVGDTALTCVGGEVVDCTGPLAELA
jgi:hypothetical protein